MPAYQYLYDHMVLKPEEFGFMPHCVPYRERKRRLPYQARVRFGNTLSNTGFLNLNIEDSYMLDRSNADRLHHADWGANLTLRKKLTEWRTPDVDFGRRNGTNTAWSFRYNGPLIIDSLGGVSGNLAPPVLGEDLLFTAGGSLVSKAIPSLDGANLGVFIAELRDGLPRAGLATLKAIGKRPFRDLADDFLNFEFGWLPLVRDVRETIRVLTDRNRIIAQWARDAGRGVRRRRELPTSITTSTTTGNAVFVEGAGPVLFGLVNGPGGSVVQRDETKTWFSGEFVYSLPIRDADLERLAEFEVLGHRLLGLELTPEVLWEAAPWSWLVDWFTNVGDVLHTASEMNSHGTVMRYGYVMAEVKRTYEFYCVPQLSSASYRWIGPPPGGVSKTVTYLHRYRRKANPYGFGVTWEGLSKTQLAILAALGMTRGRHGD